MGAQIQKKVAARRVEPRTPGAQNFAFFFLSRHNFLSFSLFGVLSLNFGGVFERRGPEMCTFGVLVLSCEAPAAPKPPGFHTTTREPKRAYLGFRV